MNLKGLFGHLRTVRRHRHAVIRHCARAGIFWQGLRHDLSKYSPTELKNSAANYTDGTRSPNEKERAEKGYSEAWMHHKGRNRHHFEYWTDYDPVTKKMRPVPMPARYLKELLCDRLAASKIYQGDAYRQTYPLEYFQRGMATRMIAEETSERILYFLTLLAEQGEDAFFEELKNEK